jgi:hypothetical protein
MGIVLRIGFSGDFAECKRHVCTDPFMRNALF